MIVFLNSQITMLDEVGGDAGGIALRAEDSVTIQNSELTSIGMHTIDPAVNGNDILVEGSSLLVKSSVVNTTVRGVGTPGMTKINSSGSALFTDSWIGGVDSPLGQVQKTEITLERFPSFSDAEAIEIGTFWYPEPPIKQVSWLAEPPSK